MSLVTLIITCEECGEVNHYNDISDSAVDNIFKNFVCKNNCNKKFLSYITIGKILIPNGASVRKQVA